MNKQQKYTYYPKTAEGAHGYYECKKSKFYSYIYNVKDVENIDSEINSIRSQHKRSQTFSICIYIKK